MSGSEPSLDYLGGSLTIALLPSTDISTPLTSRSGEGPRTISGAESRFAPEHDAF
jgi:hypothetical protein